MMQRMEIRSTNQTRRVWQGRPPAVAKPRTPVGNKASGASRALSAVREKDNV